MPARHTPRLNYPFPNLLEDPWFENMTAFMLGVDGTNWATAEDRNLQIWGGGTMTFAPTLDTLTWTAPIYLWTNSVGISWRIPTGGVTVLDGQVVFVEVDRRSLEVNPTAVRDVATQVDNVLVHSDPQRLQDKIVLGARRGSVFIFATGIVIGSGVTTILATGPGGASPAAIAALFVIGETPTGPVDGSNTSYTTANNFVANTTMVYLNGMRMKRGGDYNEVVPNTIVFTFPPAGGSVIQLDYIKV